MDAIEINYRLRRIGKSQAQIARELGISSAVVSNVIHGRITAFAVASYVAKLLNSPVEDIWPGRYVFKPRRVQRKSSAPSVDRTRLGVPKGERRGTQNATI